MQITGGSARGIQLKVPQTEAIRPTQNQVRLAIFSILESSYLSSFRHSGEAERRLQNPTIKDSGQPRMTKRGNVNLYRRLIVADFFAGSGALGIEILSRGALHVDFIEKNRKHASIIEENLAKSSFLDSARVLTTSAEQYAKNYLEKSYDLIFLDPPYKMFEKIDLSDYADLLKPSGILIYLHDKSNHPINNVQGTRTKTMLVKTDTRYYGSTGVSFYVVQEN